jgi:hypothetical protein
MSESVSAKLKGLQDRIAVFEVEQHYEPGDLIQVLQFLDGLVGEVRRIDAGLSRAANTASCLANGIQPD